VEDLTEWQKHVLGELKDINTRIGTVNSDIITLKVKASLWGFMAGGIISAAVTLISALLGRA
jgi:hypothetical protein